jgi:hypothetical protein
LVTSITAQYFLPLRSLISSLVASLLYSTVPSLKKCSPCGYINLHSQCSVTSFL